MYWLKNYIFTSLTFLAYMSPLFFIVAFEVYEADVFDDLFRWIRYDLDMSKGFTDVFMLWLYCQPTILLFVYRKRLAKIWKHLDLGRLD